MTGYKIKIDGGEVIKRLSEDYPAIFDQEIEKPLKKIGIEIEKNAKAEAPVFMGHLKNSITYEVRSSRGEAYVKVGSSMGSAIYPVVMEYGRKPNSKPPPAAALVRWVHLVLKPPADEEYMIAVRLARKIGKRGIQGRFYMKKGYEKSESKIVPWFAEAFERMLDRIKS